MNVQLIDADTSNHLWAERFDKPTADLFDVQDEIVGRLAGQLRTQMIGAEARRAELTPHPDSMDCYFRGRACLTKGISGEHVTLAREYYERALVRDPSKIDALVGLAQTDVIRGTSHLAEDRIAHLAAAEATLTKALSLAPEHASAHLHLGNVQIHTNRIMQGIAECERVLALDHNLTTAHSQMGLAKIFIGCAEETEAHINDAIRLSPCDTFAYIWIATAGLAKLFLSRDEEAVALLHRAIEVNRNFPNAHFWLAAALAHLRRLDEACAAAKVGIALNPVFTVLRSRNAPWSNNPTYLAQRERIFAGMRMARVPEG